MKNETYYIKRKNSFIRLLGLLLVGISFLIIIIGVIDSLYYNKKIELNAFVFPIILIIFGIYMYSFLSNTKDILISYNTKGFNVKNMYSIDWSELKTWTLTTTEKIDNDPFSRQRNYKFREKIPFPLNLFIRVYSKVKKHTLKLELVDKRVISFSSDEVNDMFKFLKYLHKNFKNKQKDNFKL